jgi:polysaccharide pyruvyl transferase WcaK-like protein
MINNILISGGWGYGNLGDDAILLNTIEIIKKRYPRAKINVMSYSPKETKKILKNIDVEVIPSIHKALTSCWLFQYEDDRIINKKLEKILAIRKDYYTKADKIANSVSNTILRSINVIKYINFYSQYYYYKKYSESLEIYRFFEKAELFILAGGGYYNSWKESTFSHTLEIDIASRLKVKCFCAGQSIGPFNSKRLKKVAYSGLKKCHVVNVRDKKSSDELFKEGIKNELVPDIVLSDNSMTARNFKVLTVVSRGVFGRFQINSICQAVYEVWAEKHLPIKIVVTRLWTNDIVKAVFLRNTLRRFGVKDVELIISSNIHDLQDIIIRSAVVVSSNLHGLILAWRAGIPVVCIESARKYMSFMEQIDQQDMLISFEQLDKFILKEKLEKALESKIDLSLRKRIADDIQFKYYTSFDLFDNMPEK